jgi:DNA polymerase-3 subunit delta'
MSRPRTAPTIPVAIVGSVLAGTEHHPHARAVLGAAVPPDGVASHAYLFHGPAGVGKARVARAFATALLAEGAPDPDNVAVRVEHGVHPDLTWVTPSGAAEMLVGDIDDQVVGAASRTPFEARRRVFVIERADTMNDQAANKMLKTLEEPPPFAHLILLTDRPGQVLPTIASRCQPVRFDGASPAQIAALLEAQGIEVDRAQACARLALGDPDRAGRLAAGDGPALRAAAEELARAPLHGRLAGRPWLALLERSRKLGDAALADVGKQVAAELELLPGKEHRRVRREGEEAARRVERRARTAALDQALQLAGLWYRDVACVLEEAIDVVHTVDREAALREDAATGVSAAGLLGAVGLIDEARAALSVLNATPELVLETLASRLERELRRRRD